jgi:cytidylate kinase
MSIITISRGTFSGGKAFAESLANRLRYQAIGDEVILEAACKYGIPPEKLSAAMNRPPSIWEQLTGNRRVCLNCVRAVLCERAIGGDLVYYGRAGHLLLAGISHVIRVRLIAGLENRVKQAMEREHWQRRDAVNYIKKTDQGRAKWTRFFFGVERHDASLFDATLNLSRMSMEEACEVVAQLTELPNFRPTPASQKAMENLALSSRVRAVLAQEPRTAAARVHVTVDEGIVTVTGTGRSDSRLEAIPQVLAQVEGIQEVRCYSGKDSFYVQPFVNRRMSNT